MIEFDASTLDWQSQYKLMIGSITPRPIALVTTIGKDGANAAPFSFFNMVGCDPAMIMISVGPRDGACKDTMENIQACPEFVVHIVSYAIKDRMNVCAIDFPRSVDELARAGFTTVPARVVRAPRICEAPIALECRLAHVLELGRKPYHLIVGEVVYFHYHDGIVNERMHVDGSKVDPIGRLGGRGGYVRTTDHFEMPRLRDK
jgi:flavin reductase (DIM6/NTAB) family NADH-FMN oxidoreductase RutF